MTCVIRNLGSESGIAESEIAEYKIAESEIAKSKIVESEIVESEIAESETQASDTIRLQIYLFSILDRRLLMHARQVRHASSQTK